MLFYLYKLISSMTHSKHLFQERENRHFITFVWNFIKRITQSLAMQYECAYMCVHTVSIYFPKSCPTFHRFLLPILNSTCSFPHLARTDTSFFTRPRVFPGYRKKTISVMSRRSFPPHFLSFRIRRRDRR
jgi:hypothetical protein